MEKKRKDCKLVFAASEEANGPNEILRKEDLNQSSVVHAAGKNVITASSSQDNAPSLNNQPQPVVQWQHTAQCVMDHQFNLIPNPCLPTQSPSPTFISQWQPPHPHYQQQNPSTHQVQHSQFSPHLAQPVVPFLLAQRPGYHSVAPVGTTEISWQGPTTAGGGISSGNQPQIPSFCYHVNYPYPGFPGPWDPTSWWAHAQLPACTYAIPGGCGYISSLPSLMPGCSAPSSQLSQRGIIQPPEKLSQKHQRLWEAQSAENIQLWAVVGRLQSELADYKSRLMKLESEVFLSVKPTVAESKALGTGTHLAGRSSKRGRPKKPIASADAVCSPDDSRPRARGRKPAVRNVALEIKEINLRKESIIKHKENQCHSSIQHQNDINIENNLTNCCCGMEISGTIPTFDSRIHQHVPGLNPCSSSIFNNKIGDPGPEFSILPHRVKGVERKGALLDVPGTMGSESFVWTSNISSENCRRDPVNVGTRDCYNEVNVVGEGRNFMVGWNFRNEEGASAATQNAAAESPKDEEEMEDDGSSAAEDAA
ncbi:uncharacterized protein LOC127803299 [Diospyros lotus]|uniref:uncharacterized protein LOC127803299 n=1 Tax=Diospyros lotus TaxID=55363 RepID=UPI00225AE164|nr:uncharacterized protein LOC127803299 [Diospyros lotus]